MLKRVLIFSTAYLPFIGGAEVAVKEITDRITDAEFFMFTARLDPKLPKNEKIGNVNIYRIGKGNSLDKYRLIFFGYKEAKKLGNFSSVWSIMASYAGFAALRYKKRNIKVSFLLTLQEGDSLWHIFKHVWWCWPYFKQIFKKADKIQVISNYLGKLAKKMAPKSKVEIVPNGVDIDNFLFTRAKLDQNIRLNLGLKEKDKIVVTVSRLVKKNGVEDLIRSMKFLNDDINLIIIGKGEMKGKLTNLVEELNLSNRIRFFGEISHKELPNYLWQSDVFCRPSLSEGLGNVFLEAMAAGLPVVATSVGGIPDFLIDNETGLFCKVNDPKDIAEKINKILGDSNLREKLINNGKQIIKKQYSWDLIANKMEGIFINL